MKILNCLHLALAILPLASAFREHVQRPFHQGGDTAHALAHLCPGLDLPRDPHVPRTRKVAIIGAGPSGSSASYFLKTAQDRLNSLATANTSSAPADTIKVTIFERDERIGGRTAVAYPYDDHRYEPVELGASLYADVNYNMRRAVNHFGLETGAQNGIGGETGVWDGQQFLFRGDTESWWTNAKLFLRYGSSPLAAEKLLKQALASFLRLYSPRYLHRPSSRDANSTASGFPWTTISALAHALNASEAAATTARDFYTANGVSALFTEEMIEALTRVNYAQDTPSIHAFGGLISLALSGATGVRQGNYRVFEQFIKRSGASLRMDSPEGTVTGLVKFDSLADAVKGGKITCREALKYDWTDGAADEARWWVGTLDGEGELFDAVIVAAPWHDAGITLLNTDKRIARPPYVHLYVTLLATTAKTANPEYFGLGKNDDVPYTILTSDESVRRAAAAAAAAAEGEAVSKKDQIKMPNVEFLSLNYLRPLRTLSGATPSSRAGEHIVKIFSLAPLSNSTLERLFPATSVGWIERKTWYAYPELKPTTRFPRIEVDEKLYFPNAFESLASTMETSIVSSRNTVGLLLRRWYGDAFVNGGEGCPWQEAGDEGMDEEEVLDNDEWAGWGCRSG